MEPTPSHPTNPTLTRLLGLLLALVVAAVLGNAIDRHRSQQPELRDELTQLIQVEEHFFSDSGRYTANIARLQQLRFVHDPRIRMPVIVADSSSWATTVQRLDDSTHTCAIGIDRPNPLDRHADDAAIVCR